MRRLFIAAILASIVLAGIWIALFVRANREPVFLDIVTGERLYIKERDRAAHERAWRELELVESV